MIEKIRAEIERRINILTNVYAEQVERKDEEMMNYYHGKVIALEELRPFLDTLSEEPSKSLEEEADDYIGKVADDGWEWETHDIVEAFIAGAEWQKSQMISALKNDGELPIEFIDKFHEIDHNAFQNGQKNMKEQMLKDAVEATVMATKRGDKYQQLLISDWNSMSDMCNGDKVRIVVLKEEEE